MVRIVVGFTLITLLLGSCTTQKRKGDASLLKKQYHNTTGYYNAYFNAELLIEESIQVLSDQQKDNYNKVLPMYKYTEADNPQAVYPSLDKAIEKLVVDVHLHRISHWTDDCYLQIGKCQYLKKDFESAQETLEYFLQEFDQEGNSKSLSKSSKKKNIAKERSRNTKQAKTSKPAQSKSQQKDTKKLIKERQKQIKKGNNKSKKISAKEAQAIREARRQAREEAQLPKTIEQPAKASEPVEEVAVEDYNQTDRDYNKTLGGQEYKPKSYFLKHKPCYQEGMVWLARTYIERQNYDNARMYIKQLENDPQTFPEILTQCAAAEAYSYLKQKNYSMAIHPLKRAAEMTKKRKEKARFYFILGQLFEITGNHNEAASTFEKVVKYHYSPEMDFQAKLRTVINRSKSTQNMASLEKELDKMIKERKYAEYRDQLYFSLGLLSLDRGNKSKAKEYMEKALQQKGAKKENFAEINYILANLSYEEEDFVAAKKYYDNTINFMAKNDERRPLCETRAKSIAEIARNLSIIAEQDSLLKIASMSDQEKLELAKKIKKAKMEAEEQELKESQSPSSQGVFYQAGSRPLFFAYDLKNAKRNQRDFEKKWGNRKLEDDWRRSNKSSSGDLEEDDNIPGTENRSLASSNKMSLEEMKEILSGVPDNAAAIDAANEKVIEALYQLGHLFRDKLDRSDKSLKYLDLLENRYPGSARESHAYYLQFLDHLDLGNKAKAEYYRQLIINKHPESLYATVLNDPNYFKKKKEEENKLNKYYASTYDYFSKGDYQKAYQMSSESFQLFGNNNELRAKFALIHALSIGNIKGPDEYIQALREVIAKYPNTEEQTRAREILRLMGQRGLGEELATSSNEPKSKNLAQSQEGLYKPEPEEQHYVIIVLKENGISLNDAKIKASDFNRAYFNLDQLRVSNIVLGDNNQIPVVVIRRFNNQDAAMKYYDAITKNRRDFVEDITLYEVFAISQNNYRTLVSTRSADTYRDFFIKQYLN